MTDGQARALVATLAAAFPNQRIGQATLNVYASDLADLDFPLAEKAVENVRRSSKFMPTIAEVRRAAAELAIGAPRPQAAFEQATQARGEDRHPLVRRARRMVGDDFDWREAPIYATRKAFLAAYEEILAAAIEDVAVPALAEARRPQVAAPDGRQIGPPPSCPACGVGGGAHLEDCRVASGVESAS